MSTFEVFWEGLDKVAIAAAIQPFTPRDYDFEDAKICVYDVAERWLLWDLVEFNIYDLEKYYETKESEIEVLGGFKAFLDIVGTIRGATTSKLHAYKDQLVIIDWKTSKNALDKKWKDRLIMSHQWRMYSYVADARLFMYRGIQRPGRSGESTAFREVILDVPTEAKQDGRQQIITTMQQIQSLNEKKIAPWPKSMPDACYAFGRECSYLTDCDLGRSIKAEVLAPHKHSYTRISSYLGCAERYRREMLDRQENEPEETSEATEFGKAVHAGLAEVYRQAFNVGRQ